MDLSQVNLIIRKLQWKQKDDPTSPSLTLSYLWREKMFYGSLVRYDESYARGSKVLASAKRDTLEGVVVYLLAETQKLPEPVDILDWPYEADEGPFAPRGGYVDDDIPF
jgi:hypothetical protein